VYELDLSVNATTDVLDENGDVVGQAAVPFSERRDAVIEAATRDVDWIILDRETEDIDDDIGSLRARLANNGWQLQGESPGEERIEVFKFTGVKDSVPIAEEPPPEDFGFLTEEPDG